MNSSTIDRVPLYPQPTGSNGIVADHARSASNSWWSVKGAYLNDPSVSAMTARPNHPDRAKFWALLDAIRRMSRLSDDDSLYLNREAADRAEEVVNVLALNSHLTPPKVFPHEGDSLVFIWDMPEFRRLLTVSSDEVDVADVHKMSLSRCLHTMPAGDVSDHYRWLLDLAGEADASTSQGLQPIYAKP